MSSRLFKIAAIVISSLLFAGLIFPTLLGKSQTLVSPAEAETTSQEDTPQFSLVFDEFAPTFELVRVNIDQRPTVKYELGDVNGDTQLDLLVVKGYYPRTERRPYSGPIAIYANDFGQFDPIIWTPTLTESEELFYTANLADLNRDGLLDVLVHAYDVDTELGEL
ncbi:MAG: VCBS repeat-containing protein, partial [Chloroflexota bacterium]